MISFIVGKCHASESYGHVIRYVISRVKGKYKRWKQYSKEQRKAFLQEIIECHKRNREVYSLFVGAGVLKNPLTPSKKDGNITHQVKSKGEKLENLETLPITQFPAIIKKDWAKPNFAAVPYIEAMEQIVDGMYYLDTAASIVAYFLGNATSWKGDTARAVKKELNRRLKINKI
jgi:hypothetical protein